MDEKEADVKGGLQETLSKVAITVARACDKILPHALKYYDIASKYFVKFKDEWDKHSSPEINGIVFGLFLCFYGGHFPALIAAVIATRQSGQVGKLKKGIQEIVDQVVRSTEVLKEDKMIKMLDTDNDGKISLSEIATGLNKNGRGVVTEVTPLILSKVDPAVLNEAITSVWAIVIQVSVTLQSVFARQIALGMRIGDIAAGGLKDFVVPAVSRKLEKEHKMWADWGFGLAAKGVGVVIAMFLSKFVSGFHSSLQGGEHVAQGIVAFGKAHGVIQKGKTTDIEMAFTYFFGLTGFWYQVKSGFTMNILFKILLFPALIAEWMVAVFCYVR